MSRLSQYFEAVQGKASREAKARNLIRQGPSVDNTTRSSQECGTLPYDEGDVVYCHDQRFPGPWIVKRVHAWGDACGKGDWRFYCVRPRNVVDRVKFGVYVITTPRAMWAWEAELYKPSRREVVQFGRGVRSSALGGKAVTARSVQRSADHRKAIIIP